MNNIFTVTVYLCSMLKIHKDKNKKCLQNKCENNDQYQNLNCILKRNDACLKGKLFEFFREKSVDIWFKV